MGLLDKMPAAGTDYENWIPEKAGDTIEGVVRVLDYQESDFQAGVMIPFISLDTTKGLMVVRGYHTVLRKELERSKVQVGWSLAIRYDGQRPLKKGKFAGRPVHVYTVLAEEPTLAGKLPVPDADVPF